MILQVLQVLFLLYLCHSSHEKSSSTYGQEFHIAFMSNIGGGSFTNLQIVVGTPDIKAQFIIESFDGIIYQGTVTSVAPIAINLNHEFQVTNSDFINRFKGLRIYSTGCEMIYVLAENYIEFINFGVYIAYSCQTFEANSVYEYFAVSVSSGTGDSQLLIVGCENDTEITVVPTQMIDIPQNLQISGSNSTIVTAGSTSHQFTLHSLQTLLISSANDLTGTKITSSRPLTVLSGHQCAVVPSTNSGCEPLAVQVPPTFTWGTEFLLSPLAGRRGVHIFKAVMSKDNTSFTSVCGTIVNESMESTLVFQLNTDEYCFLKSSKPVLLTQLSFGGNEDNLGDPAITLISPIDQYIHEAEVLSLPTTDFSANYISITVSVEHYDTDAILLNGNAVDCEWHEIFNSTHHVIGYGCNTSLSGDPTNHTKHIVTHSNSDGLISVLAYGFSSFPAHGYAYLTGQELKVSAESEICPESCFNQCPVCANNTSPLSVTTPDHTTKSHPTIISSPTSSFTGCNCFTSIAWACAVTAGCTAVLATTIFILVLIVIHKCHTAGITQEHLTETERHPQNEGSGYKELENSTEPTYTEIGLDKITTFNNEAYACPH